MPELPDVEIFKRYLDSYGLDKTIKEVEIRSEKVLMDLQPEEFKSALAGNKFGSSQRHGKHLFVDTSGEKWLGFHFGMTGFFEYLSPGEGPEGHPRVLFHYDDESCMVYDCQRKLGEINLVEDKDNFIARKNLGPDALKEVDRDKFEVIISNSRAMAKSTLMNQEKIAGIGNIYSDEILFQAGINPRAKASNLSQARIEDLYHKMNYVLSEAIACEVETERMPPNFLLPHRTPGTSCPQCGVNIERVKV
ncbi:Fpg/Nei family DNA glycosylase, partial [Candidatus Bipolaricaulota bacterium]|nr:Fpg/Nei family DNA glycosylase [Candidatus Bipolaricaulota bacterium]